MRLIRATMWFAMALAFAGAANAQDYPTKPIKIMVGFAPGGPTDLMSRVLSDHFTKVWGQPVVVENKAGLGGSLASDVVAHAAPDGYTLLATGVGGIAINHNLLPNPTYDPKRDFAPISLTMVTPMMISVGADVPVNTFREFVAYAKANGSKMNYSTPGTGSSSQLGAELVKMRFGFESQHVPFRGVPAQVEAILKGDAQWMIDTPQSSIALHRQGKIKTLVIGSKERWPLFPDIPTFAEASDAPEFTMRTWFALAAPAATPKPIIEKLAAETKTALEAPEANQRIRNIGLMPMPTGPAELARYIEEDTALWARVIKEANVKPE